MKKFQVYIFCLILAGCNSGKEIMPEEVNVLFIGNSLTYYHEMPDVLQEMLNETDPNIKIDQITFPGMSLNGHLDNIIIERSENGISSRKKEPGEKTETEEKILGKNWDIIILQTGTVQVLIPESREYQVIPAIDKIKDLVKNPDARFILFNTWASNESYPKEYCYMGVMIDQGLEQRTKYCSQKITNRDQEIKLINEGYKLVAQQNDLELTSHGRFYHEISRAHPDLELLEDAIHPSRLGAFLNACLFYEILTDKKAAKLDFSGELDHTTARIIKGIVEKKPQGS